MRKDMPKLLCERPRIGVSGSKIYVRRNRRHFNNPDNFEDGPKRTGIAGRVDQRREGKSYKTKYLNEFLAPLARFLESRAGQLWDDVYSEIRANLNLNSATQLHIMQHLWQYVDRDVRVSDQGTLVRPCPPSRSRYRWGDGQDPELTVNGRLGWQNLNTRHIYTYTSLYIHPVTGILCDLKKEEIDSGRIGRRRRQQRYGKNRPESKKAHQCGHRHFVKQNGIWYELDVVPLPNGWKWGQEPKAKAVTRPLSETQFVDDFGPRDHFFGNIAGKKSDTRWHRKGLHRAPRGTFYTKHLLKEIKKKYGSTKVYCPGTWKQCDGKTLRKVGLQNESVSERIQRAILLLQDLNMNCPSPNRIQGMPPRMIGELLADLVALRTQRRQYGYENRRAQETKERIAKRYG